MDSTWTREYQAWQTIVRLLRAAGAVTEADCKKLTTVIDTPGAKLFAAIRDWGEIKQQMGEGA